MGGEVLERLREKVGVHPVLEEARFDVARRCVATRGAVDGAQRRGEMTASGQFGEGGRSVRRASYHGVRSSPISTGPCGARRVRLVRGEGRGVST